MSDVASTADEERERGDERDRPLADLPLPPGPDGLPVLGSLRSLTRDPRGFYGEMAEYGDVVRYSVPGNEFVAMLHPDHVERVLLTENEAFGKWGFEEFGGEFASEGLLLTGGEQWRRQRTTIQNAFTPERIEGYARVMTEYAEDLVDDWDDGDTVALNRDLSRLTLRVLAHSLFDLDLAGDAEIVTRFTEEVNDRADVRDPAAFIPMWVPTPRNRRYKRSLAEFREFVEGLIDERRGRVDEYDDLLSLLLTAEDDEGETMSEVEVRDQMTTFLFAGHETTSLALTYALVALAEHDDVMERLDAEHEAVLGGATPGLGDVGDLEYTERVVEETLRLYPPAFILFREVQRDLAFDGYRVPEGTKVSLPQFHVHADDRWYDDPQAFRPGRWEGDRPDDEHDYAYFPFGGGPRHCIGMRFAMLELKTALPAITQRVDLDLLSDPDPEVSMGATLRPDEDVRVEVHER